MKKLGDWVGVICALAVGTTVLECIAGPFNEGTGLIGWRCEPEHRQTYLEYVKERLEVERLMR